MKKTIRIDGKLGTIVGDYVNCGENTPLVIITHSRRGHRNTGSKKIANYLRDFNISSLRIDLYGYGESEGKFEDITITTSKESVLTALNYANSNLKHQKIFLFGTSYGGSGILGALDEINTDKVVGLIFRCTILNYLAKTHREFSEQELNNWKERGYVDDYEGKLNYSFVEDMKNYDVVDHEKLSKFKTLYFYAGKDTKVLKSEVDDLESKVGDKIKIVTYPNSVHGIDIEEDFNDMLTKTKDFVLEHK